jgi:hypothetical protein
MNDKRVRRIDHSKCDHPQTKAAGKRCRDEKIKAVHGKTAPITDVTFNITDVTFDNLDPSLSPQQRGAITRKRNAAMAAPKSKTEAVVAEQDVSTIGGTITVLDAVVDALSSLGEVGYVEVQVDLPNGGTLAATLAEDWSWQLQVIE